MIQVRELLKNGNYAWTRISGEKVYWTVRYVLTTAIEWFGGLGYSSSMGLPGQNPKWIGAAIASNTLRKRT